MHREMQFSNHVADHVHKKSQFRVHVRCDMHTK